MTVVPPPIPAHLITQARRPTQSGEWEVWLSVQRAFLAASQTGGSGQPCAVYEQGILAAGPRPLAITLLSPATGLAALSGTVGIYGENEDGFAMSGQAHLSNPSWTAAHANSPLPVGSAFEVPTVDGKRWRRIDAVYPSHNLKVGVIALPTNDTFSKVGCVIARDLGMGREMRIAPTGSPREISRWLPGGELSVSATPAPTHNAGLGAFAGSSCTALIRVTKEAVTAEHLLVVDWMPSHKANAGEGESLVTGVYSGPFAATAAFTAHSA